MATVAVLGTGIMGAPMARQLLAAGHEVRVWNRTEAKAVPLADDGATVAGTPGEAADGARVLVTVLSDADAVEAVVTDASAPLEQLADDGVWIQMSTVGDAAYRLQAIADEHGVGYVDAPVLGTRGPAEQGELLVIASGDDRLRDVVQPVFDAVGKRTTWVGPAGAGSRLKLVVNAWLLGLVEALAESIALAEAFDLDPELFLDAIDGGPVWAPYAGTKGQAMIERDFEPSFPVQHALKDAGLITAAAADRGLDPRLAQTVAERFQEAVEQGLGGLDMSAVVEVARRRSAT